MNRASTARAQRGIASWSGAASRKFAQTLKKGEHVYDSGELRYREYDKEIGKS
jgi:single-stranded DNA-binding protein